MCAKLNHNDEKFLFHNLPYISEQDILCNYYITWCCSYSLTFIAEEYIYFASK